MYSLSSLYFRKWIIISAVIGLTLFALYSIFSTNIQEVFLIIEKTNIGLLALAFLCVLGAVIFNTLSWQNILKNLNIKIKFRKVFDLSWVGIFIDALIPGGWSGDIFKAYLLSKDEKADGAKSAASIVIKNILELLITLAALITGITLLTLNYTLEGTVLIAIGTTMFLLSLPLIIIIYLATNLKATQKLIKTLNKIITKIKKHPTNTTSLELKINKQLEEFHDGILILKKKPKAMTRSMIFQIAAWTFDILVLYLIFVAINQPVGPDKVIITNTIVVNIQSQGVALVGFAQLVSSSIYQVLGISPLVSVTSSLLAGFASFWFKIVISFFAFQCTVFSR